jgi:hypothetical protein
MTLFEFTVTGSPSTCSYNVVVTDIYGSTSSDIAFTIVNSVYSVYVFTNSISSVGTNQYIVFAYMNDNNDI